MGKPSSSCFKIIACGSDSSVEDDIEAREAKGPSDKRGWSFGKRSARHRVLNNSVTTENLTSSDKEVSHSTSLSSQIPAHPATPEKVVALEQSDKKPLPPSLVVVKPINSVEPELSQVLVDATKLPKSVQSEVPEPQEVFEAVHAFEPPELIEPKTYDTVDASEVITTVSASVSEPSVPIESKTSGVAVPLESPETGGPNLSETVVASQDDVLEAPMDEYKQTGGSGSLAQGELVKMKSIVKLQAAIRGHLVRRQAVDTLYCIQGIVKVQSLVKARHFKASGDEILTSQSSIEKLLENAFARKLLDSTPKSNSTVIHYDPLKPSPSRLWLERWMDLYSYGLVNLQKVEIKTADGQSRVGRVTSQMESENLSKLRSDSVNPVCTAGECQNSHLLSNKGKMEEPYCSSGASFDIAEQNNTNIQLSSHPQAQSGAGNEDPTISTTGMVSKQAELESKKLAYGSKKPSNPSFVAAQSKFEELSLTTNYSGSLGSTHQKSNTEYNLDTASSREENFVKEREPSGAISVVPYTRVNMGGSENGTELSVTSALDSPYLSEAEATEVDLEVKYGGERSNNPIINESLEVKTLGSTIHESDSSSAALVHNEFDDSSKPLKAADFHQPKQMLEPVTHDEQVNSEYDGLKMAVEKSDTSASGIRVDSGSQTEKLVHKSSPGASPNNYSHKTSSSQVSGKRKKNKADKNESITKHSFFSAGKRTPAKLADNSGVSSGKRTPAKPIEDSAVSSDKRTPTKSLNESGARNNSAEHLSKDQTNKRRRNSFGSTKSDSNDQEPRDSISSTKTLPSYMQATTSAKAKVNSPRSSPDVHDTDTYMIKKRHSLPGASGRQVSPRVQQPTSQSPQSQLAKGSTNTPPQERKWIR